MKTNWVGIAESGVDVNINLDHVRVIHWSDDKGKIDVTFEYIDGREDQFLAVSTFTAMKIYQAIGDDEMESELKETWREELEERRSSGSKTKGDD